METPHFHKTFPIAWRIYFCPLHLLLLSETSFPRCQWATCPYTSILPSNEVFCGHYAKILPQRSFQIVFCTFKYLFKFCFRRVLSMSGKGRQLLVSQLLVLGCLPLGSLRVKLFPHEDTAHGPGQTNFSPWLSSRSFSWPMSSTNYSTVPTFLSIFPFLSSIIFISPRE